MPIIQYIFLRSDLKKFSKGALIAQACHSSVEAIEMFRDHDHTCKYLQHINDMHKVILRFEDKDIETTESFLKENHIDYTTWLEQPENILTSLALRPYESEYLKDVIPFFCKFRLF